MLNLPGYRPFNKDMSIHSYVHEKELRGGRSTRVKNEILSFYLLIQSIHDSLATISVLAKHMLVRQCLSVFLFVWYPIPFSCPFKTGFDDGTTTTRTLL